MNTLDGLPDFPFTVQARDGAARAGILETPHGTVLTPCFMPVGTKGAVKAIAPEQLRVLGAQVLLANTYHLALRPGSEVVRRLGGLHRFMHWDGPILTDSGGYQVFSLRDTAKIDDASVTFRSVYDGSEHVFTPERAMAEQQTLGADLVMCLDQCPPGTADAAEVGEAVRRTSHWAARCKQAHLEADGRGTDGPQMLFGIVQGGVIPRLRRESAAQLTEIGFAAYAIGGLTVGEDRAAMLDTTELTVSLLPQDRLRYFMGIGDPEGLVEVIARGVDLFDCVLPTRMARTGTAFTGSGRLNLRNAGNTRSTEPLEDDCPCTACRGYSRGVIRHLVMQKEILGLMLLTEHNLTFLTRLVAAARAAIVSGNFASFRAGLSSAC
jgi:queuine tRNA-ribosyltransferase